MKKYLSLLGLIALLSFINLGATANANYDLQIDEKNNEVYLMSGDTQITLDNVNKYITGLNSELNLGLINTGDSQTDTGATTGTGTEISTGSTIGTGNEVSSGAIAGTGAEISTGTTINTGNATANTGRILGENVEAELLTGDEFDRALYRMYKNGLTKYDNSNEFRPYDNLTREESAKMIGQLYSVLGFPKEDKGFNCSFVDTNMFDPTLAEHIYNVCRRGIFRGNDKTQQYMPHDNLTKGQLLAVLLRIFEGKMRADSGE